MNTLNRLSGRKFLKKLASHAPIFLAFAAGLGIVALAVAVAVASDALQKKAQPSAVVIYPYLPTIANPNVEAEPQPQPSTF